MIEASDEPGIEQIIRWIRSGQNAQTIVTRMRTQSDWAGLDMQRFALQTFLINLAHSTGSLRQIVRLAVSASSASNRFQIPRPEVFKTFCNRIVLFSSMEEMLRPLPQASRAPSSLLDSINGHAIEPQAYEPQHTTALQDITLGDHESMSNSPPIRVSAAPWTSLTTDDDAVSHLVSLFLIWINPTWRFVEVDVFLFGNQALRGLHLMPTIVVCDTLTLLHLL